MTQNKKNKVFIEEETAPKKLIKTKIINFKEKEMIPLTDSESKFYEKQEEVCQICKKEFCYDKNEKNRSISKC